MNRSNDFGQVQITNEWLEKGIGYISQSPWVQNTTIRENILFGKKFEPELYWKVVDACALTKDFQVTNFLSFNIEIN